MRTWPARLFVFVCLAGLSPSGTSRSAPAVDGRYVVVSTDGTTTTLSAAPERKGDRFVGHLLQGGQFVSFPVTEVDEAKTAEANTPSPTPPVKARRAVLEKTPLPAGESRKLRIPRQEAERTLATSSGTGTGQAGPAPATEPATGDLPAGAVDRHGHGEAFWRKRAAPFLSRAARAEADLEKATAARDSWQRSSGAGTPAWQRRLHRLNEAVTKARAHIDEAGRQHDRLAEEARKAGAYPGWIR
jgi:hypothetical protein